LVFIWPEKCEKTHQELHSILNQMIHKEKNPPNTTISLESNSEDTHSVVEIINVEKPDIKNPNKITLACKFLTEKIDLKKGYNNVDLTIDDFKKDLGKYINKINKENVFSGVAAFGKRVKSYGPQMFFTNHWACNAFSDPYGKCHD
jgi:protein involved in ribonucleotide reduction